MSDKALSKIVTVLGVAPKPLALHELQDYGLRDVSQAAASARLREAARPPCPIVMSVAVPGKKYTAWLLISRKTELLGQENS